MKKDPIAKAAELTFRLNALRHEKALVQVKIYNARAAIKAATVRLHRGEKELKRLKREYWRTKYALESANIAKARREAKSFKIRLDKLYAEQS